MLALISSKKAEQHIQITEEIENDASSYRPNIVSDEILIEGISKWNMQKKHIQNY